MVPPSDAVIQEMIRVTVQGLSKNMNYISKKKY